MSRKRAMKHIEENWTVKPERAAEFFSSLPECDSLGNGCYGWDDCLIQVRKAPDRQVGNLRFPAMMLDIQGPPEQADAVYHQFKMRFLSVGG